MTLIKIKQRHVKPWNTNYTPHSSVQIVVFMPTLYSKYLLTCEYTIVMISASIHNTNNTKELTSIINELVLPLNKFTIAPNEIPLFHI